MFERSCKQFIQPLRVQYSLQDFPLMKRDDFIVLNKQGLKLVCSIFNPHNSKTVILYCHSYNSCRLEGLDYIKFTNSFALCCFDFQAAGMSEGNFVTFGVKEKDDIEALVNYLSLKFHQIILWGRSMGATSILLYLNNRKHPKIKASIIDSPFMKLTKMASRMIRQRLQIPKFIVNGIIDFIQKQIYSQAQFQFQDVCVQSITSDVPILMLGCEQDKMIPFKHFVQIFRGYKGPKQYLTLIENHNDKRYPNTHERINEFFQSLSPLTRLSPSKKPSEPQGDDDQLRQSDGTKIKQKIMLRTESVPSRQYNSAQMLKQKGLQQLV